MTRRCSSVHLCVYVAFRRAYELSAAIQTLIRFVTRVCANVLRANFKLLMDDTLRTYLKQCGTKSSYITIQPMPLLVLHLHTA